MDSCQRVAENDQRCCNENIPRIEESQPTQYQCDDEEAHFVNLQFGKIQIHFSAPAAQKEIQCHCDRQQCERHRQHMRMHIPEQIREEGKLIDRINRPVTIQVIILDDA